VTGNTKNYLFSQVDPSDVNISINQFICQWHSDDLPGLGRVQANTKPEMHMNAATCWTVATYIVVFRS